MRKQTRVNAQFIEQQKLKRKNLAESDSGSENSVPALRNRLTVVEEIIAIRSYALS